MRQVSVIAFLCAARWSWRPVARTPRNPSRRRRPLRRRWQPRRPRPCGPGGFGAPGVWVFTFQTADNGSGYAFFHKTSGGNATRSSLNPAVDYFLAPNISLGANLSVSHSTGNGHRRGGRRPCGLQPRHRRERRLLADGAVLRRCTPDRPTRTDTSIGVLAPFIWHATTHFFLGGGPDLNRGLSNGGSTEYGLDFMLGGWL